MAGPNLQPPRDRPFGILDDVVEGVIWLLRYRRERERRRRKRLGVCYYCGYDVRGTEGPCPECGRLPLFRKDAGSKTPA